MAVPTDIAGLRLWHKADAITPVSDGTAIGTWPDSSGNGFDATQVTGGKQPTYRTNVLNGLPTVRFDGTDDVLNGAAWTTVINTTGGGTYTVLAMLYVNAAATAGLTTYEDAPILSDSGGNTGFAHGRDVAGTLTVRSYNWDGNEDFSEITGVTFDTWFRLTQDHSATTLRIKKDGGTFASAASGVPSASGAMLIGSTYPGGKFFNGDLAELIIYNTVLSDSDRDSIEAYLLNKYVLTFDSFSVQLEQAGNRRMAPGLKGPGTDMLGDFR